MNAITSQTSTTDTVTTKKIIDTQATMEWINAELDSHIGGQSSVYGNILVWNGEGFDSVYSQIDGEIVGYSTSSFILDDPPSDDISILPPAYSTPVTKPDCCENCPDVTFTNCFLINTQNLEPKEVGGGTLPGTINVRWNLGNFTKNGVAVTPAANGVPTVTNWETWSLSVYYKEIEETKQDTDSCNASCPCPDCYCTEIGLLSNAADCPACFKSIPGKNAGDPTCFECYNC